MKFTTAQIQMPDHQFEAITSFAAATDLAGLQQVWPMTQRVLELNGVKVPSNDELPSYDVDVPAFQRWIVGSVRPNLSNAVIQLLTEPSPQGISFIKKTPVERIEAIRESGILDEVADHMMMVSSAIYLKLGIQFDTAAAYFLSEDTVSDELLWKMRVLFAVNGLSAGVLGIETAKNPHMSHLFSAALIGMIRSPLNANLVKLLDDKDSDALRRDHGITVEIIDKAHQARLVLPTTKERADKILRPTWGSRLRRLLKGKG